jgi:hypothetical protein
VIKTTLSLKSTNQKKSIKDKVVSMKIQILESCSRLILLITAM